MNNEIVHSVVKLNQHFLSDRPLLEQIVAISDIDPNETVLEIGPGQGSLTSVISDKARKVIAIESDTRLKENLSRLQSQFPNLSVVYGDALEMRLPKFDRIIANIPFNITEPLIMKLIGENFKAAYLLVGESFAQNCCSDNGDSTRLGLLTKAHFNSEYLMQVSRENFTPVPSTDGALIGLYPVKKNEIYQNFARYMVRCMWGQKTRPVRDALAAALSQYMLQKGSGQVNLDQATKKLEENYQFLLDKRVVDLGNSEFRELYEGLSTINLKKVFGGHKPRGGAQNWRKTYEAYLR